MAGRRGKKLKSEKEKQDETVDPRVRGAKPLRFGKLEFYVGAKLEALENKQWYAAKVVKINEKDRKVLIHFEGWNQRYDCWLPIHSPKLKASTKNGKELDSHETDQDYSVGDHVLARWANGRHYPAEVVGCKGDGNYEVLFFDGFRKVVSKANMKLDKKKMYRDVDNKMDKNFGASEGIKTTTDKVDIKDFDVAGSSRHRKPVSMTDFVTPALKRNKRKNELDDSVPGTPAKSESVAPSSDAVHSRGRSGRRGGRGSDDALRVESETSQETTFKAKGSPGAVVGLSECRSSRLSGNSMSRTAPQGNQFPLKQQQTLTGKMKIPDAVTKTHEEEREHELATTGEILERRGEICSPEKISPSSLLAPRRMRESNRNFSTKRGAKKSNVVVSFQWKRGKSKTTLSKDRLRGKDIRHTSDETVTYLSKEVNASEAGQVDLTQLPPLSSISKVELTNQEIKDDFTAIQSRGRSLRGKRGRRSHRGRHRGRGFGLKNFRAKRGARVVDSDILKSSLGNHNQDCKDAEVPELKNALGDLLVSGSMKEGGTDVEEEGPTPQGKASTTPPSAEAELTAVEELTRPIGGVFHTEGMALQKCEAETVKFSVSEELNNESVGTVNNTVEETEERTSFDFKGHSSDLAVTADGATTSHPSPREEHRSLRRRVKKRKRRRKIWIPNEHLQQNTEVAELPILVGISNEPATLSSPKISDVQLATAPEAKVEHPKDEQPTQVKKPKATTPDHAVDKSEDSGGKGRQREVAGRYGSSECRHLDELPSAPKTPVSSREAGTVSSSKSTSSPPKSKSKGVLKIKFTPVKKRMKSTPFKNTNAVLSEQNSSQKYPANNEVSKGTDLKTLKTGETHQGRKAEEAIVSPLESLSKLVSSQSIVKSTIKNDVPSSIDNGLLDPAGKKETFESDKSNSSAVFSGVVEGKGDSAEPISARKAKDKKAPNIARGSDRRKQRTSGKGKAPIASMVEQDRPSQVEHSLEEMKRILSKKLEREQPVNRETKKMPQDKQAKERSYNLASRSSYPSTPEISNVSLGELQVSKRSASLSQKESRKMSLYGNTVVSPPPTIPNPSLARAVPNPPQALPPAHDVFLCSCGGSHPVGLVYRCRPPCPPPPPPQPCTLMECSDPKCLRYHQSPPPGYHSSPPPVYHSSPPPLRIYQPTPSRSLTLVGNNYDSVRQVPSASLQPPLPQIKDVRSLSASATKSMPSSNRTPPCLADDEQEQLEEEEVAVEDVTVNEEGLSSKVKTQAFQAKKKRLDLITGKLSAQKVVKTESPQDTFTSSYQQGERLSPVDVMSSSTTVSDAMENNTQLCGDGRDYVASSVASPPSFNTQLIERAKQNTLLIQSQDFSAPPPELAMTSHVYVTPSPYPAGYPPDPRYVNPPVYGQPRMPSGMPTGFATRGNSVPMRHFQPLLPKVPIDPSVVLGSPQYSLRSGMPPSVRCYTRPPPPYCPSGFPGPDASQAIAKFPPYPPSQYAGESIRYYSPIGDAPPPPCTIPGCQCLAARGHTHGTMAQPLSDSPSNICSRKSDKENEGRFLTRESSFSPQLRQEQPSNAEQIPKPTKKTRKSEKPMPTMVKVPNSKPFEQSLKSPGESPSLMSSSVVGCNENNSQTSVDTQSEPKQGKASNSGMVHEKRETRHRTLSVSLTKGGSEIEPRTSLVLQKSTSKDSGMPHLKGRKIDKEHVLAPKEFVVNLNLTEFKCMVKGCDKSFRKSSLLDYHVKYFHSPRPPGFTRKRSSVSMSSTESNSSSVLSPVDVPPSKKVKTQVQEAPEAKQSPEDMTKAAYTSSTLMDDNYSDGEKGDDSWEDSALESDVDSEVSDVSDVIRCLCQDEDEQGFMIQCEQCYTWQHGDCVHLGVESVPNKYLCYLCRDPTGLRKNERFKNDYEWFRRGSLPCLSERGVKEHRYDDIILASHGIMVEISNIKDSLYGMKQKAAVLKTPRHAKLKFWMNLKAKTLPDPLDSESVEVDVMTDDKEEEPSIAFDLKEIKTNDPMVTKTLCDKKEAPTEETLKLKKDKPLPKNPLLLEDGKEEICNNVDSSSGEGTNALLSLCGMKSDTNTEENELRDVNSLPDDLIIKPRDSVDSIDEGSSDSETVDSQAKECPGLTSLNSTDLRDSNADRSVKNAEDGELKCRSPKLEVESVKCNNSESRSTQSGGKDLHDNISPGIHKKVKEERPEEEKREPEGSKQDMVKNQQVESKEEVGGINGEVPSVVNLESDTSYSETDEDVLLAHSAVLDDLEQMESHISTRLDDLEKYVSIIEEEYQIAEGETKKSATHFTLRDLQGLILDLTKTMQSISYPTSS